MIPTAMNTAARYSRSPVTRVSIVLDSVARGPLVKEESEKVVEYSRGNDMKILLLSFPGSV